MEGRWGPARSDVMMNNWNPVLLDTVLCNNDVKLITNGEETRHITFYFTNYATKHQQHSFNSSALLARTLAYHHTGDTAPSDVLELNKKLIQHCANSLSRDQEFSAPEVVSYLMGWGDRYVSHHFEPIHITTVISLLKDMYPALDEHRRPFSDQDGVITEQNYPAEDTLQAKEDTVSLQLLYEWLLISILS